MKKTATESSDSGDRVAQFETSLKELEAIVQQMEKGDLKLEESLKLFERGTALTRQCKTALDAAELRVKQLTASADKADSE